MPDLIAQGPKPHQRWRRELAADAQPVTLGRTSVPWCVPWDENISRQHAELQYTRGRLWVRKLDKARNEVFFRGQDQRQFDIGPGEHFVIGQTTFTLSDDVAAVSLDAPAPLAEHAYRPGQLSQLRFRDAESRLRVLGRLPEVIAGASSDSELAVQLVNLLLTGMTRADAAALVSLTQQGLSPKPDSEPAEEEANPSDRSSRKEVIRVLHWDRRLNLGGDFFPSQRLILKALQGPLQSVQHVWRHSPGNASTLSLSEDSADSSGPVGSPSTFTQADNVDWAFCVPVTGGACPGWGLYLCGRFSSTAAESTPSELTDLREDIKFTELVAEILNSLRQIRQLQRKQLAFRRFFSPVVLQSLAVDDPEDLLAPREAEVTVLFCDLRGFSRHSERSAGHLMELLHRVSEALGVMTHHMSEQGGVIGDFHGDSAMGFWGWPLAVPDAAQRAAVAALRIRAAFQSAAAQAQHRLRDFEMGIGIASGPAVAGEIGTAEQGKVTVFGPVVNLASRLEGMTKILRAPILLDEATALKARSLVPQAARLRRLGVFRPYGLESPVAISELLPPETEYPQLSNQNIADFEEALDALQAGRFAEAFSLLHKVPPEDVVKDFLTVLIAQHNRQAPADWDGVIALQSKR